MTKQEFLDRVDKMTAEEIASGILSGTATREEVLAYVRNNEIFSFTGTKRKAMDEILKRSQAELDAFAVAETLEQLEAFIAAYPKSLLKSKAEEKIDGLRRLAAEARTAAESAAFAAAETLEQLDAFIAAYPAGAFTVQAMNKAAEIRRQMEENLMNSIMQDINVLTPDAFLDRLTALGYDAAAIMRQCCERLNLDYDIVAGYDVPRLAFGSIPEGAADIPSGFTDIFFWGMPSSGKTCALAAILNTMNACYTPVDPIIKTQFGMSYRHSLTFLFKNGYAYLPPASVVERTQYMPFRLKAREEADRFYRNISFFELSGEIFKYIYDIVNGSNIAGVDKLEQKNVAFNTVDLLLGSSNQKIHFFFIDHSVKKQHIEEQGMFLNAAATYFTQYKNIFKKRTDAVYIVLTKADGICAENDKERSILASEFLHDKFGAFINAMGGLCERHSINNFSLKIFSIGDVYFSKICKINRKYSQRIIDELLAIIRPAGRFDAIDGFLS